MSMYDEHGVGSKGKKVNPYDKRKVKNSKKSMSMTEKSVKPVAKDTNKTRRAMVKPTNKPTIAKGKM